MYGLLGLIVTLVGESMSREGSDGDAYRELLVRFDGARSLCQLFLGGHRFG